MEEKVDDIVQLVPLLREKGEKDLLEDVELLAEKFNVRFVLHARASGPFSPRGCTVKLEARSTLWYAECLPFCNSKSYTPSNNVFAVWNGEFNYMYILRPTLDELLESLKKFIDGLKSGSKIVEKVKADDWKLGDTWTLDGRECKTILEIPKFSSRSELELKLMIEGRREADE